MIINNLDFDIDDSHPITTLSEIDKAYIAGLVDGEGCFSLTKKGNNKKAASFTIAMCDKEIIKWLHNSIGCIGSFRIRDNQHLTNRKDVAVITIQSRQCLLFASVLLPYLRVKKRQAEIVIEYALTVLGKDKTGHWYIRYTALELLKLEDLQTEITKLNFRGRV